HSTHRHDGQSPFESSPHVRNRAGEYRRQHCRVGSVAMFVSVFLSLALFGASMTQQPDDTTALHLAARSDDVQLAATLIKAGADPRKANRIGATPMFLAAENGSAMMIELLLKSGVDPNAPVLSHGETALMMAAR